MATAQLGPVLRHIRRLAADQKMSEQSDGALLRAFLGDNDPSAFEVLMRRHGPMVLHVCRRTLGNGHDAEDACQATFLVLAQQARSIRKQASLASWLHGVAYRMATHAKRSAARRHRYESRVSSAQPSNPALTAAWQEIQVLLDEEIERLPETLRAPFVSCCLENKSSAEAARQLGLQEATVWKRVSRARKLLQEQLTRRGVSLAAVLAATAIGANGASAAVPHALLGATVKAAAQVAAGQALTGGSVPAQVISLVEGVNQAMFLNKCKTAILLLLAAAVVGFGLARTVRTHAAGGEPPPSAKEAAPQAPGEGAKNEPPQPANVPADAEAKESIHVRGRVLDPDGKPFAGAKLYLGAVTQQKERTDPVRAVSGYDGGFQFTFPKSQLEAIDGNEPVYQVLAAAPDHGVAWATADPTAKELTLRLVKDWPVIGRIIDTEGKPVAGAKLTVTGICSGKGGDDGGFVEFVRIGALQYALPQGWVGSIPGQPAVLTTGADGRFKLAGVGRDRVLSVRLEGAGIATAHLGVHGASYEHQAAVSRPIRGMVRDKASGKPLTGVVVFSIGSYPDPRYREQGASRAVTDTEGRYELLGVAKAPRYTLAVKPAKDQLYFQRQIEVSDAPGLEPLTADINMVQGLTVTGKVTDKEGKPIKQALVEYYPLFANPHANVLEGIWHPRSEATTSSDGSYALTVLPGQGVIGVVGTRKPDVYMPAFVAPKEIKGFFKVPIDAGLKGDQLNWAVGGNALTYIPGDGEWHALLLLEPGDKETGLVKNATLEPAQERKGRVVGPDGQPLTGVTVGGLSSVWHVSQTLKGDEFTVRGLNPRAPRQLFFHHKDKNLGFFLKELPEEKSGPLTIKLEPCGSVRGRMVDGDGQPIANMPLNFGSEMGVSRGPTTDKEGRFSFEGLIPGLHFDISGVPPGATYQQSRGWAFGVVKQGESKDLGDVKAEPKK
jgi:RNA polymerase sigma factor (sigma-70 family)